VVELYATYGAIVYARCRHMLHDDAAAEDAAQETFLRAHRHAGAIPDGRDALSWLYRVATNLCINAIRDARARPLLFDVPPEQPTGSFEDRVMNRQLAQRVAVRVSPKLAEAAWFFHVDGMKQDEIAALLGITRRAVAKRLSQFARHASKILRRNGA
jgi:RNA polymerase sigma-70 factor, ECF subfamily